MKSTGVVRKLDQLGRIVIPMELRRTLDLEERDALEIFTNGDMIVFKKYAPLCIFCNGDEKLIDYEGKKICTHCRDRISKRK